ncbi:MAG TPA: hypothetical protein VHA13_03640 [Gammaproteobacteria bacterium]|nr:hypothetical protein [Gammaproteobacteria bacterium]
MFELKWTNEAANVYQDLESRAKNSFDNRKMRKQEKASKIEGFFKQVHKALEFLKSNPQHPSLNTHEYDSIEHPYDREKKVFEAYAQNNTPAAYRIFWCYGPDQKQITIIDITAHP